MSEKKQVVATAEILDMARMARTLLVLNNYKWLVDQARRLDVRIVPLKGVDLLNSIYAGDLNRDVSDIDILCPGHDNAIRLVRFLCEDDYRLKDPFAMREENLSVARKITLKSCSLNKIDIDIHLVPVTKKFFSHTVTDFNNDAILRSSISGLSVYDRWMFLAQHAAFHNFCKEKWVEDLRIIYRQFAEAQIRDLRDECEKYGFRRMYLAAINKLSGTKVLKENEKLNASELSFIRYLNNTPQSFGRSVMDRVRSSYWEFIFIDGKRKKFSEYLRLMFPPKGILANIYKFRNKGGYFLFYPLNILITGLTGTLFAMDYLFSSRKRDDEG